MKRKVKMLRVGDPQIPCGVKPDEYMSKLEDQHALLMKVLDEAETVCSWPVLLSALRGTGGNKWTKSLPLAFMARLRGLYAAVEAARKVLEKGA